MSLRMRTLIITALLVTFSLICVLLMKAPDPKPRKLRRFPAVAMGKTAGYFSARGNATEHGDRWHLTLNVTANQDTENADVVWHLPADTRVLNGETAARLTSLRQGETRTLTLEVSGLENTIHAEVFTRVNGIKLGAVAAFARPPETAPLRIFGMKHPNIIR